MEQLPDIHQVFFKKVSDLNPLAVIVLDILKQQCIYANKAALNLLGYKPDSDRYDYDIILDRLIKIMELEREVLFFKRYNNLYGQEYLVTETTINLPAGGAKPICYYEIVLERLESGNPIQVLITFEGTTQRPTKNALNLVIAEPINLLPGIIDRLTFQEEVARIEKANQNPISVMAIGCDGLTMIEQMSDSKKAIEVINFLGKFLKQSFRGNDFIARISNDEFIIIMPKTHHLWLERVLDRFKKNLAVENENFVDFQISISIGGCTADGDFSLFEAIYQAEKTVKDKRDPK